jgi:hypothetical protein
LTRGAIGSTEATNRLIQGFLQNYRNQTPPVFPRRLLVKRSPNRNQPQLNRKLNAYQTHTKRILAASSLAVARNQPDRRREVMLGSKWFVHISIIILSPDRHWNWRSLPPSMSPTINS